MRKFSSLLLLILAVAMWGCSSSDDPGPTSVSPEDQAAANEAATETMGDLLDDMEVALDGDFDPNDVGALMEMDLDSHKEAFEGAIAQDPNCGPAHFGLAFVEMVNLAQADDIQNIIDEFGDELGGMSLNVGLPVPAFSTETLLADGLMGRSFEILRRSPLALSPQEIELGRRSSDKADGPLIRNLQTHIHDVILPETQSIVDHLAVAESDPNFSILIISGEAEPDTVEIDLGEVYVLDAVVRALRSGLLIATAYDVELAPNGDYSWITDLFSSSDYTGYDVHTYESVVDTLFLYDDEEVSVNRDAAFIEGIDNLLTPGSYFLTLWTNPWSGENAMQTAYTELNTLLAKLETAYNFILAEEDDQSNDLISQILLAELDEAVLSIGDDLPDYIGTWETIPDVIAWIEEVLSGPYTIPVELNETETFDLAINLSALFLNPVADWKTKLPYMEILDVEEWASFSETIVYGPYNWNPMSPYNASVNDEDMVFNSIGAYYIIESNWDTTTPLHFLDGPDGDVIEEEFLYFPDYTFGGLFPDMDRDGWLTLTAED